MDFRIHNERSMAAAIASNLIGRRWRNIVALTLCLVALSSFEQAMADTVNGEWCSLDGRRLEISFENVRLNERHELQGDYDRHQDKGRNIFVEAVDVSI